MKVNYKQINITTQRLIIRPQIATDYDVWIRSFNNCLPPQNEFDISQHELGQTSRESYVKRCEAFTKMASEDKVFVFGLFLSDESEFIGQIDIATLMRHEIQWANLGYFLLNRFWAQGFATEAVGAALRLAMCDLGFNRVEASMATTNQSSITLVERLKMRCEGIRSNFVYENGAWQDYVVYAANPSDIGLPVSEPQSVEIVD